MELSSLSFVEDFFLSEIKRDDFSEVVRLVNSAYRGDSSRKGWTTEAEYLDGQRTDEKSLEKELEGENKTVLCVRNKKSSEIIGTVFLEQFTDKKGPNCYLGMLTVKPTLQNSGLGKWILNEVELHVKRRGVHRITLGVLNPRHELMAWYERRGFVKNGITEEFPYGQDQFGLPKTKGLHFVMFEKTI
jgi:ribosomal protein S18 acetylase RimI-like enzyme